MDRRYFLKSVVASGMAFGGCGYSSQADTVRKEGTYRIYFITDPHLVDKGHSDYEIRLNSMKHFVDAVNKDNKCDLAFNLGDTCQGGHYQGIIDSVEQWNRIETTDYLQAKNYPWFTLGNHEVNTAPCCDFMHKFYQTEKEEGASLWNGQFKYKKYDYALHFVIMDCMFDGDNNRSKKNPRLHDDTVSWMRDILQKTDCNMVILMAHAMPHFFHEHGRYYWKDENQGTKIADIVEDAINTNQNLEKVAWFAGHWHGQPFDKHIKYTSLGNHLPGYRIPPAQDATSRGGEKGVYSVVEINPQGDISIKSILTPAEYILEEE